MILDAARHPSVDELAGVEAIAQYLPTKYQSYGASGETVQRYLEAGIGVIPIFEEDGNKFLGGWDDGVDAASRAEEAGRAWGLPPSVPILYCLIDPTPKVLYGNEDKMAAFAAGIDATSTRPEWGGYGSADAFKVARPAAPRLTVVWGVSTWGFGDTGGGPPDVLGYPANMLQLANAASPVPGTDLNRLYVPFPWWGSTGGSDMPAVFTDGARWVLPIADEAFVLGATSDQEAREQVAGAQIVSVPSVWLDQVLVPNVTAADVTSDLDITVIVKRATDALAADTTAKVTAPKRKILADVVAKAILA